MRLDLRPILRTPGASLPFQFELDLSGLDFSGEKPFAHPVRVGGTVRNMAGALSLEGTAETTLELVCDRCLKPFARELALPVSTLLAEELEDEENDEIVLLEDGEVDAGDLARTAFILGMDTKTLCSEDCKGLCPRCGADLNLGPCGCGREADPRLAVPAKLLENRGNE